MFLKSLTLKGFKSFAEATTLELEPGITVVVGPNGSGKSNVVDAIAWVLGAQAPSTVRSQKMDDVIFAGTVTRAPLGRAEVLLTLDNSAGILPIEFSEVMIRRTLFRSGDSEYSINDVACRLLDVQELLSDAGVGRQQHVIIGQGQIDAVLNARPEDRRAIVEEAAGVLKFRKRKEKAQRRLDATEATLLRVQDLLREVRRQLRPLQRQADAARRHGELIGELTQLRIFVAGRNVASLRTKLTALATTKIDAASREAELKTTLARLDAEVTAASSELNARGADDVSDRLRLVEQLRERSRGIGAVIGERRRALQRDRGQLLDADVVASLEGDAARFAAELTTVRADVDALEPEVIDLELAEQQFAAERKGVLSLFDPAPGISAASAIAEVRGELRSRKAALERTETEIARAQRRSEELTDRAAEIARLVTTLRSDSRTGEQLAGACVAERDQHEVALAVVEGAHGDRLAHRQHLAERASGAAARVDALQLAIDAARTRAGTQRLAGVDGMLGTLLDLVRIDDGWESAVEAALGEALGAVVVADPDAAVRAMHALRSSDTTGAVLALGLRTPVLTTPPDVGERVRPHVTADLVGVDGLLDRLLAAVVCASDLDEAISIARREPSAVVVTPSGDRFGEHGWRIGAGGAGVTAAALDDAEARAAEVAGLLAVADQEVRTSAEQVVEARRAVDEVDDRWRTNEAALTSSTTALARAEADQRQADAEHEPLRRRLEELTGHIGADTERIAQLELLLPALEAGEAAEADAARSRRQARAELDARATVLTGRRRDLDVRGAGLAERAQFLRNRLDDTDRRLGADADARAVAEQRRVEIERSISVLDHLGARVDGHRLVLDTVHSDLVEHRRRQSEEVRGLSARLDQLRAERTAAERHLDEVRERARRAEVEEAEARLRLETAVEMIRNDLDIEPEDAEAAPPPELPDGVSAQARARELDRELRLLGPINPLALEEFTELQQRHGFLEEQLDDVRTTRRELNRVIKAVDDEIQRVFASAFADVADHFATLFVGLFPGGSGRLVLTDPHDLLSTGIEVEAKPGGKNVKKLSLLSGGERSLTALAFLFAVFRSRPSPFYVMDEVEAALDDVNLHRFLGLLAEFRREAQLLVVSHQKRTMEAGDSLLGVTMQPGGSSKVIVERVTSRAG